MEIALWVLQILLAIFFLGFGYAHAVGYAQVHGGDAIVPQRFAKNSVPSNASPSGTVGGSRGVMRAAWRNVSAT